jgi:plastocyanin
VHRGDRLTVTARYSDEAPHSAVMGIMHLYVAPARETFPTCPPPPRDVVVRRVRFPGFPGRTRPPRITPQLSALGPGGVARPIVDLPGPFVAAASGADVTIRDVAFQPSKLAVRSGATVTWRFADPILHDVTLASGPRAFASGYRGERGVFQQELTVPGEYRIFCSLHPVTMSQIVRVEP